MEPVLLNKNNGFTLIEFLVAIVILMVGMLGLLQTINYAYSNSLVTQFRNEGIAVADEFMMETKARPFDAITSGNPVVRQRDFRSAFKVYSCIRTVTKLTGAGASRKSIQITVESRWKYKGKAYSHAITTVESAN